MLTLYSRMKELITLQYGSFTILGERAKEFAQGTGCSKQVANQTLLDQLYLNELKRAPRLEYHPMPGMGLFLLEYLLHYAATM